MKKVKITVNYCNRQNTDTFEYNSEHDACCCAYVIALPVCPMFVTLLYGLWIVELTHTNNHVLNTNIKHTYTTNDVLLLENCIYTTS